MKKLLPFNGEKDHENITSALIPGGDGEKEIPPPSWNRAKERIKELSNLMNVPFVDLKSQYRSLKSEIDPAIQSVINETAFVGGHYVDLFEKAFAEKCGAKHCVSCANGTDAIYITLKALGIGPGDEVITAANSFIATSEAISQTGARPVFVDIDKYFHIDPARIESKITKKTKAVIPVHLFGQPADIAAVKEICDRRRLSLVEDCAQSHFATSRDKRAGTFGIAGTFSFYPGKNLGAYGDGGAIVTESEDFARKARLFASHGSIQKYIHEIEGINSRLDAIQAAVLQVKLRHIDDWNKARNGHALRYSALLRDVRQVKCPELRPDTFHIFHLYVIRAENRDDLATFLKTRGVLTGIHYPTALPLMPAYHYLKYQPSDFPVARECQEQILSLPMFPELTDEQITYVTDSIKEFYGEQGH
jgi:dTDP-4-amino-4,6-dideoxygalactose transaminase